MRHCLAAIKTKAELAGALAHLHDTGTAGLFRVNGVVVNMAEFQEAFACPKGAPMVRENACRVW